MKRAFGLTLVLLALAGGAHATDLVGVFEDALHNDPVIRQADATRLAAREARPQAWSALLPQVNGTAGVTRDHNAGVSDQIVQLTNTELGVIPYPVVADTTTKQWALNLRQNLFSWSNWMALKAAGHEVAQAEANYQAAEQNLILRVGQAYFNVLAALDSLDANQAALEGTSRQLDQANKRFEVGLIAITDVEDAKAARDSASAAVIAAKRTLATMQDQLQEITGQKYDSLSKPGSNMPLATPEPADVNRWVDTSLEQNLTLLSSRLAADIARDNVHEAIGGHLPTLDLVAGRSWQSQGVDETIDGLPFSNVDSHFNDRQIGLQFTLPIFSGGYTQSKVRQTQYQWIAAKEAVVQSSRATERQARDAYLGVISGIARVQSLSQAVTSNYTALKATEAGYDVGTRTSVDVVTARRNLVQAQTDYATSRYDYLVSVLQLRLAAGTLDRQQLHDINNWLTVIAPTLPPVLTPESLTPAAGEATPPVPPALAPPPGAPLAPAPSSRGPGTAPAGQPPPGGQPAPRG
jgi:outer membrane protein